jgi:hypothetical protein
VTTTRTGAKKHRETSWTACRGGSGRLLLVAIAVQHCTPPAPAPVKLGIQAARRAARVESDWSDPAQLPRFASGLAAMPGYPHHRAVGIAFVVATVAMASVAHSQVYKCTDGSGKTSYSDAPCDAMAKPLKLPDDPKKNVTNPHMCAQLQDETRRLAAQAERDAKQGRPESADNAKQRQTMTRRYEERCVGIARSEAKPK